MSALTLDRERLYMETLHSTTLNATRTPVLVLGRIHIVLIVRLFNILFLALLILFILAAYLFVFTRITSFLLISFYSP